MLVAIGVADRDDRFARHQVGRRADRGNGQRARHVNLDDGQIGFHIAGDQLGNVSLAVSQGDEDFADAVDNVMIGHDVAAGIDQHTGAHAVDAAAGLGCRGRSGGRDRGRGDGLFAANVHHRAARPLNRLDDRGFPQFRGSQAGRKE